MDTAHFQGKKLLYRQLAYSYSGTLTDRATEEKFVLLERADQSQTLDEAYTDALGDFIVNRKARGCRLFGKCLGLSATEAESLVVEG